LEEQAAVVEPALYIVYQFHEEKAKQTLSLTNVKQVTAFFHKYNMSGPLGICDDFLCVAVALPRFQAGLLYMDKKSKEGLLDWTQFATSMR
jgi:hypothetical protein